MSPREHEKRTDSTPAAAKARRRSGAAAEVPTVEGSADWVRRAQGSAGNAAIVAFLAGASGSDRTIHRVPDTTVRRGGARARKAKAAKKAAAPAIPAPTTATTEATTDAGPVVDAKPAPKPAEPVPTVPTEAEAKAAALEAVIGKAPMANMVAEWGDAASVVTFAGEVGHQRLKQLIDVRKLTAPILRQYGSAFLKTFVGCGDAAWSHLVTAKLNGRSVISGGHDDTVFYDFLDSIGYTVIRTMGGGEVFKVIYGDADGNDLGSKTLIAGLAGKKSTWQGYFNAAIWNGIRAGTFAPGSFRVSADGWSYGGFYKSGKAQVDTVFPV